MASTYTLARLEEECSDGFKGSWIWKIDSLLRICHFLWLCHHNSVLVREVIASRGIECEAKIGRASCRERVLMPV